MGSSLGPTLANNFIGYLESKIAEDLYTKQYMQAIKVTNLKYFKFT